MDLISVLLPFIPSWVSAGLLVSYFGYLALFGSFLPGKIIPGATLPDGSHLNYCCNGLLQLTLLVLLLAGGVAAGLVSPTAIADRGLELLSATLIFSIIVTLLLYVAGRVSRHQGSSLKPHVSGNLIHDWWFGIQLNPQFMGIDLKYVSVFASIVTRVRKFSNLKSHHCGKHLKPHAIEVELANPQATTMWDIIAERLGFMLVFGDLVWIPFTFSIQVGSDEQYGFDGLERAIGREQLYRIFRGANKQKHVFKKNPKALIWGRPPKVIGGKLLASGYWGIARHCNYLGDLLLALSFSLPCGISSPVPYFYPIYLLILLIWRERRDEARCAEKYKDIWAEYCKVVPWRILPYVY
ncbi:hypothetical protein KSS87_010362 [Heliosperma pusillum]|nr:hypothetical protein KSS87_010362 [Heliosperma pusillum]